MNDTLESLSHSTIGNLTENVIIYFAISNQYCCRKEKNWKFALFIFVTTDMPIVGNVYETYVSTRYTSYVGVSAQRMMSGNLRLLVRLRTYEINLEDI